MIYDCADNTCLNNNGLGVCMKYSGRCVYRVRKREYKAKSKDGSLHRSRPNLEHPRPKIQGANMGHIQRSI